MLLRSSSRSSPTPSRAASSVGSYGAPSTAAHTAFSVSASYYPPLAQSSADRQHQAEEDAGEGEEETVVGGRVDGRLSRSTDSVVRVGQSVHSVQQPAGLVCRSVSDTTTVSADRIRTRTLPRYVRESIVLEQLATRNEAQRSHFEKHYRPSSTMCGCDLFPAYSSKQLCDAKLPPKCDRICLLCVYSLCSSLGDSQ